MHFPNCRLLRFLLATLCEISFCPDGGWTVILLLVLVESQGDSPLADATMALGQAEPVVQVPYRWFLVVWDEWKVKNHPTHTNTMASRDLTASFLERRTAALKRRGPGPLGSPTQRLTAGGTDEGHSLSLMEVRMSWQWLDMRERETMSRSDSTCRH